MKTILYSKTIDYDFPLQQRPHHIMNILASRGWKVYWVNTNRKKADFIRKKINDNFEIYTDWGVFLKRVPEVDVYYSSWSFRYDDLDDIKYKVCVYDSLDNFEQNSVLEHEMIKRTDILLTTSQPLYDLRSKEHENIYMCRNACFPELGEQEHPMPNDLIHLKNSGMPIILFSGALASQWCDLELIEKIAKKFNLVVVGQGWGLRNMPDNIIYLGNKSYNELQAYYHHCDVNILPFKRCQVADYSNPIKNYEAMSHGKITVAINIPEVMLYPDVIFSSSCHSSFLGNINKALRLKNNIEIIKRCKEIANENSWYKRVDIIEGAISKYCTENNIILGK
jgi:glycosyltransferase involved in cell wall biosynthesis